MRVRRVTATLVLAAVTIAVSLAVTATGQEGAAAIGAGFIPARADGAALPPEYWSLPVWVTPLSATLIHLGLLHLASNLVMLVFAGSQTERAIGPRGVLIVYLVGAYAAAAGQWLGAEFLPGGEPFQPVVGASGAVSALIGAYAVLYGRTRARAIGPVPAWLVNALWIAAAWALLNYLFALALADTLPIAWQAHIGGFVAGMILARPLMRWRFRERPRAVD